MAQQATIPVKPAGELPTTTGASADSDTPLAAATPDIVARPAEFAALQPTNGGAAAGSLEHLLGVTVTVTAELGRSMRPIGDVLKYGIGAVVELDRPVEEPVDLLVQGVRIGRGEVVVVNDRFAIRVTEIAEPKRRVSP